MRTAVSHPHTFAAAIVAAALGATPSPAGANDGGIAFGGSPSLLKGHPTVSMAREVIRLTVDKQMVAADCLFTFVNHGPACTVRMGFPDVGVGASDPDEEKDPNEVMHSPPRTTFRSFCSWVNGRTVPTRLVRADEEGHYWHAKVVRFPAHATIVVRDLYTQAVGGGIAGAGVARQIGYVLHTGSSWHGNIGRTEVTITFRDPALPAHLIGVPASKVSRSADGRDVSGARPHRDVVVWTGPCRPAVAARTVRFVRENWRPRVGDDIELTYGYTSAPR